MNSYSYKREKVDGVYIIDNPRRRDKDGKQVLLATEVQHSLKGHEFTLSCMAGRAAFRFKEELTPVEQALLRRTVEGHKNNE